MTRETLTAYGASEIDRVVHEHRNGRTGAEHHSHVLNVLRQAARDRRTIERLRELLKDKRIVNDSSAYELRDMLLDALEGTDGR